MAARKGGSYEIDKNGRPQLRERTKPAADPGAPESAAPTSEPAKKGVKNAKTKS